MVTYISGRSLTSGPRLEEVANHLEAVTRLVTGLGQEVSGEEEDDGLSPQMNYVDISD